MRALIKGLPPESALARAVAPDMTDWRNQEELLATLIEVVDMSNRLYIQAHSEPHSKAPEPIEIPRPYRKQEPPPKPSSPQEVRDFFAKTSKAVSSNGR